MIVLSRVLLETKSWSSENISNGVVKDKVSQSPPDSSLLTLLSSSFGVNWKANDLPVNEHNLLYYVSLDKGNQIN